MSGGSGYDAVVDVDDEVRYTRPGEGSDCRIQRGKGANHPTHPQQGDLGHTDLQEDLEFHNSNFNETTSGARKAPSSSLPPPATASSPSSSKRFLWTISFYAQFFDVDTSAVLSRCWAALFPRANFLDVLEGNPDLYGPFWIATTVVLILFLGGTVSQYLSMTDKAPFAYDFKLLSGASRPTASHRSEQTRILTRPVQVLPASYMGTRSSSPLASSLRSATLAASSPTSSNAGPCTATPT